MMSKTMSEMLADLAARRQQHDYLSTGCFHGDHDYCKSMVGMAGEKRPGTCKHCEARCICSCHES